MPNLFKTSTRKPFAKKAAASKTLDRLVSEASMSGNPAYMASVLRAARQQDRRPSLA